jgi:hypothetical protein
MNRLRWFISTVCGTLGHAAAGAGGGGCDGAILADSLLKRRSSPDLPARCHGVGGAPAATAGHAIAEETSMTLIQASRRPLPVSVLDAIPGAAAGEAACRRAAPLPDAADGRCESGRVCPSRRPGMPGRVGTGSV